MKKATKDMRYRRTQRNLKSALIKLLKTKKINQISVRELAELADINRATFYLHYNSPYDLLASLENELFETIFSSYKIFDDKNPDAFFMILYKCLSDNYELSKILLHQNSANDFAEKLRNEIQSDYISNWLVDNSSYTRRELEYYSVFVIDGFLSVIKGWIFGGMQESPEYMVNLSKKFLSQIAIGDWLHQT